MTKLDETLERFSADVQARPATLEDLPVLCEMAVLLLAEWKAGLSHFRPEVLTDHIATVMAGPGSAVFVVESEGDAVGMMCCGIAPDDYWDTVLTGALWCMYVRPEHRHQAKYMFALCKSCIEFLKGEGVIKVRTILDTEYQSHISRAQKLFGMKHSYTFDVYDLSLED